MLLIDGWIIGRREARQGAIMSILWMEVHQSMRKLMGEMRRVQSRNYRLFVIEWSRCKCIWSLAIAFTFVS